MDYEDRGIFIDQIDTHSLRAGGANALHLNGYSDREIQKMGRWKSDTFKEYITEGLNKFSEGMSTSMKKLFKYVNVQGRADDLVEDRGDLVTVVDTTREMVGLPYEVVSLKVVDWRGVCDGWFSCWVTHGSHMVRGRVGVCDGWLTCWVTRGSHFS